jgi:hypothetical protein
MITTRKLPDKVNGDTFYDVLTPAGEVLGRVRDCLSRGDNFHITWLSAGRLRSRYYGTLMSAAKALAHKRLHGAQLGSVYRYERAREG